MRNRTVEPKPVPWEAFATDNTMAAHGFKADINAGPRRIGVMTLRSDADFVVRAINSHKALVDAAKEARFALNHHGIHGDPANILLDRAIAQAEERL